jgi:beta-galactosidase/beta-glucuronidase
MSRYDPETMPIPDYPNPPDPVFVSDIALITRVVPKNEIETSAQALVDKLLDTDMPLRSFVRLHNIIAILDVAKQILKERAITEVNKEDSILGAKVVVKQLPAKWEYDDPQLDRLELEVKARKKLLQTITKDMVDADTGEIAHPAVKHEQGVTLQISF